jgi:hypothetical protein
MSYMEAEQARCSAAAGVVELLIEPREKDLGGFSVRRVLPASDRQMVGPFIFFDHIGPAEFPPGEGIQVRPHPHIGLATITYLFEGEMVHRDSLGFVQVIRPGAVNLMTAGRGIVHSERAGEDLQQTSRLHGIQSWMALPAEDQEMTPAFEHVPVERLPLVERDGISVRVIMGSAFGVESPVTAYSPMIYLSCELQRDARLDLPRAHEELAIYVVEGSVRLDDGQLGAGTMAVLRPDVALQATASAASRVMVIGGASLGPRHIWWNLVATSHERIEQAKRDWQAGRFDPVPGDAELIPLPDR